MAIGCPGGACRAATFWSSTGGLPVTRCRSICCAQARCGFGRARLLPGAPPRFEWGQHAAPAALQEFRRPAERESGDQKQRSEEEGGGHDARAQTVEGVDQPRRRQVSQQARRPVTPREWPACRETVPAARPKKPAASRRPAFWCGAHQKALPKASVSPTTSRASGSK